MEMRERRHIQQRTQIKEIWFFFPLHFQQEIVIETMLFMKNEIRGQWWLLHWHVIRFGFPKEKSSFTLEIGCETGKMCSFFILLLTSCYVMPSLKCIKPSLFVSLSSKISELYTCHFILCLNMECISCIFD